MSERAFTSRSTLQRIEAGNANVGIGIYAAVLHALGLLDGLSGVADIRNDSVGQALSSADLPKHVHARRTAGPAATADVEVHIDLNGQTRPVGVARSNGVRGAETVLFEYTPAWLNGPGRLHSSPATIRTSWSGLISVDAEFVSRLFGALAAVTEAVWRRTYDPHFLGYMAGAVELLSEAPLFL